MDKPYYHPWLWPLTLPLFPQNISGYFCGHALLAESLKLAVIVHFSEFLTASRWEGDIQLLDTANLRGAAMAKRAPSYIFETRSHSAAQAGLDAPTSCLSFLNALMTIVWPEPGFASPPYASSNHPGLSSVLLLSRYHLWKKWRNSSSQRKQDFMVGLVLTSGHVSLGSGKQPSSAAVLCLIIISDNHCLKLCSTLVAFVPVIVQFRQFHIVARLNCLNQKMTFSS